MVPQTGRAPFVCGGKNAICLEAHEALKTNREGFLQAGDTANRKQDAGHVGLAQRGVMANGERLAGRRQDDFLRGHVTVAADGMNAHAVNHGELPVLTVKDRDFFFMKRRSGESVVQTIQELCATRLPKNMGIPSSEIQVLSPTRRHETGTVTLNRALQAVLNPAAPGKKEKQFADFSYREGDRVMQIRNNYDIMWKRTDGLGAGTGVFNGDIGTITRIDFAAETVTVLFDDRETSYGFDMLRELEPAYAMTVHKSQGSEYRAVILAAWSGSQLLLTRSILYTAITRARELFIIVGNEEIIAAMTRNDRQQRRYSGLKLRLEREAGNDHETA